MSLRALSAVWDRSQAAGATLLVALALADWADDDGYCWPSLRAIERKARLSRQGVINALQALEQLGELERSSRGHQPDRERRRRAPVGGFQVTNEYRLKVVNAVDHPGSQHSGPPARRPGSQPRGPKVVKTGSGVSNTPDPSSEPSPEQPAGRPAIRLHREPWNPHLVRLKLHELLNQNDQRTEADLSDEIKAFCARAQMDYDSGLVATAIRGALGARRKRA